MKRQTKRGDEIDAVEHRSALKWRRGEVREIKRRMNRRDRQAARQQLRSEED